MMQQVLEILKRIKSNVNFETEDDLIERGILTSFEIIRLVSELNNEFDIEITPLHIIPENFANVNAICKLVEELADED